MPRSFFACLLGGLLLVACSPKQGIPVSIETPLEKLRAAEPDGTVLKETIESAVQTLRSSLGEAPGTRMAPARTISSITIDKAREELPETLEVGSRASIEYAFEYAETSPTEQFFVRGTVEVEFEYQDEQFVAGSPKVDAPSYGVTDIITGQVADCVSNTPVYKAEITVWFRDGHQKRLYTDSNGKYLIRAVKGEEITVTAKATGFVAATVETFVPDHVDFSLCAVAVPPSEATAGTTKVVAAGVFHTCAMLANGGVRCWGQNTKGQLGNGTIVSSPLPVTVSGITSATGLAAGAYHTCVLLNSGSVSCWGNNDAGQLGDGTFTNRNLPVSVPGLENVVAVGAGGSFTCALKSDATVSCWGLNNYGQLGSGTYNLYLTGGSRTPVTVEVSPGVALEGVTALAVGGHFACALKSDALLCWGFNNFGQLGLGSATGPETCGTSYYGTVIQCATRARTSQLSSEIKELAVGQYTTCVLLSDTSMRCFGDNRGVDGVGALGVTTPVESCVMNGYTGACGLSVERPVMLDEAMVLFGVTALPSGASNGHMCINVGDDVFCWGSNNDHQLGNGKTSGSFLPIATLSKLSGLALGFYHTCGIRADGGVTCWGRNTEGELGVGNQAPQLYPVKVRGL
jgi:alpha-tubulin suppressor-like RCC1 family protein